jgi:hypothetical protein
MHHARTSDRLPGRPAKRDLSEVTAAVFTTPPPTNEKETEMDLRHLTLDFPDGPHSHRLPALSLAHVPLQNGDVSASTLTTAPPPLALL